jgi:transforming growth factor-beta-induced protein
VADNGVVHKIDSVLWPAFYDTEFWDLHESLTGFEILFDLLGRVDLRSALGRSTNLTVFAPTNDAFFALGVDTLALLIDPLHIVALEQLMAAHIATVVYPVELLVDNLTIESSGSGSISVTTSNYTIMVNDATILQEDILVRNGIVHSIDKVLGIADMAPTLTAPDSAPTLASRAFATTSWMWILQLTAVVACFFD